MKYDTEYIDKYLNGELSKSEVKAFEEKMKADKDFAYEVELQDAAIQAIQYPKFVDKMNNIYERIKEPEDVSKKIEEVKEPTPVVEMKPKPLRILRWALVAAASIMLIVSIIIFLPKNPMAVTTQELAEKAIGKNRGNETPTPMTLYQQSVKLFDNQEYESAIKLFDQVIKEDTDKRAAAKFFKADALHRLGRKKEVIQILGSIDKSSPLYDKAQKTIKEYNSTLQFYFAGRD